MYNDIDLEVDNNNENSVNVENLVNVSFESLIFPSKNLPPCFYNGNISENLENIYNSYSVGDISATENDNVTSNNLGAAIGKITRKCKNGSCICYRQL